MADAGLLKEMNLKKIRTVFREGQSFSKTSLVETTGLSFPTVGKIVDELVKSHELQAVGSQISSGGRCGRIYQYNPDYRNAFVMMLEGQTINWFILDSLGMTKKEGFFNIESDLLETLTLLLQTACHNEPSLCCFVMGIAANTDGETIQQSFEYPQLKGVNLLKELQQASGLKGKIGNDMWYSAEGSWQRCRLDDHTSLVSFYLGQCGFGSSFVFKGKALKGAHHKAGEVELLPWMHKGEFKTSSQEEPISETILHCILTYAIVTDPDFIQLYSHPFFIQHKEEIETNLKQCFGDGPAPELVMADNFRLDYEMGLSCQALKLMAELED